MDNVNNYIQIVAPPSLKYQNDTGHNGERGGQSASPSSSHLYVQTRLTQFDVLTLLDVASAPTQTTRLCFPFVRVDDCSHKKSQAQWGNQLICP